ncbi:MAG TPA: AMP-binding protein, partial [Acidimicrobiales bacterium]|nr:AMP-binding protein [Acidimicrobiales bacterium]
MGLGPMHGGLERAASHQGDRVAVRALDRAWTFGQLDLWADALGAHLAQAGVGPGDRVAVLMANRVEFVVAVHAVSKLGAATVLISPAWKSAEVGAALALTEPVHAVADADGVALLARSFGGERVTDVDTPVIAALATGGARTPERRAVAAAAE